MRSRGLGTSPIRTEWRSRARRTQRPHVQRCILALLDRFEAVGDGSEIAPGVTAFRIAGPLPGPSRRPCRFRRREARPDLRRRRTPALLDEPEWVYVSDGVPDTCAATRLAVVPTLVDADVLVACGHYPGSASRPGSSRVTGGSSGRRPSDLAAGRREARARAHADGRARSSTRSSCARRQRPLPDELLGDEGLRRLRLPARRRARSICLEAQRGGRGADGLDERRPPLQGLRRADPRPPTARVLELAREVAATTRRSASSSRSARRRPTAWSASRRPSRRWFDGVRRRRGRDAAARRGAGAQDRAGDRAHAPRERDRGRRDGALQADHRAGHDARRRSPPSGRGSSTARAPAGTGRSTSRSGSRSSGRVRIKTFTATTSRPVVEGEPTLFEIWVCADGYWCDHTKNLVVGRADAAVRASSRRAHGGLRGRRRLRAARARASPSSTGASAPGSPPWASPASRRTRSATASAPARTSRRTRTRPAAARSRAGMVLAIEPGCYIDGGGGLRLEDNFLITETAPRSSRRFPTASSELASRKRSPAAAKRTPSGIWRGRNSRERDPVCALSAQVANALDLAAVGAGSLTGRHDRHDHGASDRVADESGRARHQATVSQAPLASRSTRTSSESSVPSRRTTSPKCGDSSGIRPSTSPTWLGYTFTPRTIEHVVAAPDDRAHAHERATARARCRGEAADVARPVPDRAAAPPSSAWCMTSTPSSPSASGSPDLRVDDLGEEVILVHVRAGALLGALARHARTDDLGEPEDVRAADAEACVDLLTHALGPRLGSDDGEAQAVVLGRARRAPRARSQASGRSWACKLTTSGRRSSISVTWRSVMPPETGTTFSPSRSPPPWSPSPPVKSP